MGKDIRQGSVRKERHLTTMGDTWMETTENLNTMNHGKL
jgi:hypothetical protein